MSGSVQFSTQLSVKERFEVKIEQYFIAKLPKEILCLIFQVLKIIGNLQAPYKVCKRWHHIIRIDVCKIPQLQALFNVENLKQLPFSYSSYECKIINQLSRLIYCDTHTSVWDKVEGHLQQNEYLSNGVLKQYRLPSVSVSNTQVVFAQDEGAKKICVTNLGSGEEKEFDPSISETELHQGKLAYYLKSYVKFTHTLPNGHVVTVTAYGIVSLWDRNFNLLKTRLIFCCSPNKDFVALLPSVEKSVLIGNSLVLSGKDCQSIEKGVFQRSGCIYALNLDNFESEKLTWGNQVCFVNTAYHLVVYSDLLKEPIKAYRINARGLEIIWTLPPDAETSFKPKIKGINGENFVTDDLDIFMNSKGKWIKKLNIVDIFLTDEFVIVIRILENNCFLEIYSSGIGVKLCSINLSEYNFFHFYSGFSKDFKIISADLVNNELILKISKNAVNSYFLIFSDSKFYEPLILKKSLETT